MEVKKRKVTMNKVILMGGSHHNGLGFMRSFGVNGIAPYEIIIGEKAEKAILRTYVMWCMEIFRSKSGMRIEKEHKASHCGINLI